MENSIIKTDLQKSTHIPFDDMAQYVFSDGRAETFMKDMARINNHIMECQECYNMYQSLMTLYDKASEFACMQTAEEKEFGRVLSFLFAKEADKPIENVIEECRRFKKWLSFSIKNMKELIKSETPDFSHPRLVTIMKSSSDETGVEETQSEIRSSLFDKDKNRVSIGLDGTLSLYFDAKDHSIGKRVIILPDDEDVNPQMLELTMYDDSISYVRFEGVLPGKYTILVEE